MAGLQPFATTSPGPAQHAQTCWLLSLQSFALAVLFIIMHHTAVPVAIFLQLLDEYFGKDEELTEADAFLKSFLANKAWKEQRDGEAAERPGSRKRLRGMDGDSSSSGEDSEDEQHEEAGADDDEDEQFLEEVDRFEAAYNFRCGLGCVAWIEVLWIDEGCLPQA